MLADNTGAAHLYDAGLDDQLTDLLDAFDPVSLEELDQRAALLRRVDHKYAVSLERLRELARGLQSDHQILEIEGRRTFGYRSAYFDTPERRCFLDHVEDRVPRFKARTRMYEDTGQCVFEVKLKRTEDETDKRQVDHDLCATRRLTPEARECLEEALMAVALAVPDDLEHSLTTSFSRVTLAARRGSERLTCDLGVALGGATGQTVHLHDGLVLVETKSENGESPADALLADLRVKPLSLSKYRVGIALLDPVRRGEPQPGSDLFA